MPCDLGRSRLPFAYRFAQALDGYTETNGASMPEHVRNRFRGREDGYGNSIDAVVFDAAVQLLGWVVCEPHWQICESRSPVLGADGEPDTCKNLVRQSVIGQCRSQADDAFGNQLRSFGQRATTLPGWLLGRAALMA